MEKELPVENGNPCVIEDEYSGMKVELLKYPTSIDWGWVRFLAMNTVGKNVDKLDDPMTQNLKKKYLKSEHSPIRYLTFIIRMTIPYCDSVCFCRHKLGVEHFVQSQRNDRQDKFDRYKEPQGHLVSHVMVVNAQELMFMARRRLCHMASKNCQKIMKMIKHVVLNMCPEFEDVLVPNCEYLHCCPEFKSCGYWDARKDKLFVDKYWKELEKVKFLDDKINPPDCRGPVESKLLNELEQEVAADNAKRTIEDAKKIADGKADK